MVVDATCLIVGFPTFGDFHMMVDYSEGALINKATKEMSIYNVIEIVTETSRLGRPLTRPLNTMRSQSSRDCVSILGSSKVKG